MLCKHLNYYVSSHRVGVYLQNLKKKQKKKQNLKNFLNKLFSDHKNIIIYYMQAEHPSWTSRFIIESTRMGDHPIWQWTLQKYKQYRNWANWLDNNNQKPVSMFINTATTENARKSLTSSFDLSTFFLQVRQNQEFLRYPSIRKWISEN